MGNLQLPITVGLAAVTALGYLVSRARHRRGHFSVMDALTVVLLMAIVTATAVPVLEAASEGAKRTALLQNLHAMRSQIELYRVQHKGQSPLLYQGTLPQLIQATDADGVPGQRGSKHPFGPYLPAGIPANSFTGRVVITATEQFPPSAPSGGGGWLYHQETGQLAADLPDMLDR
jgi:general secretion pathway protein G